MTDPTARARIRRASGTVTTFNGHRLSIARRMARQSRAELSRNLGVSPAAITQLERGQIRPAAPTAAAAALQLGVPIDFLCGGAARMSVPAGTAHFRSLRSAPAISRDQAIAYAEIALEVLEAIEAFVDLPAVALPQPTLPAELSTDDIDVIAHDARRSLGVADGPVPNVVRLLEAVGVLVLQLPDRLIDARVDAFSSAAAARPVVVMSPHKNDKARSRFDAAHELGHLLLHPDATPGSKLVENQAHDFAAEFLTPAKQIAVDLPHRLDWDLFYRAKRKWGVSLRALVYRAHRLGLLTDHSYRRANIELVQHGNPEPIGLGPAESPSLLGRAVELLAVHDVPMAMLAEHASIPEQQFREIVDAATSARPTLDVAP